MKLRLKYLVAAVAVAAASSAFADGKGPDDGGAELFLNVWQKAGENGGTANASYTLDLQVTLADFVSNNSVNLFINRIISDQYFTQLLNTSGLTTSTLQFSVFTGDRTAGPATLISTFGGNPTRPENGTVMGINLDQMSSYIGENNQTGSFFSGPGGSSYNTAGAAYYGNGASMAAFNGTGSLNSGLVGTNLSVYKFVADQFDPSIATTKTLMPGSFSFAKQGSDYVLQYQVAAVPEPTGLALALAGFGMVGFMARRRRAD